MRPSACGLVFIHSHSRWCQHASVSQSQSFADWFQCSVASHSHLHWANASTCSSLAVIGASQSRRPTKVSTCTCRRSISPPCSGVCIDAEAHCRCGSFCGSFPDSQCGPRHTRKHARDAQLDTGADTPPSPVDVPPAAAPGTASQPTADMLRRSTTLHVHHLPTCRRGRRIDRRRMGGDSPAPPSLPLPAAAPAMCLQHPSSPFAAAASYPKRSAAWSLPAPRVGTPARQGPRPLPPRKRQKSACQSLHIWMMPLLAGSAELCPADDARALAHSPAASPAPGYPLALPPATTCAPHSASSPPPHPERRGWPGVAAARRRGGSR